MRCDYPVGSLVTWKHPLFPENDNTVGVVSGYSTDFTRQLDYVDVLWLENLTTTPSHPSQLRPIKP